MPDPLHELISYLEELSEPHILFDQEYRIIAANSAYQRQFSQQVSVIGRTCYEVSHHFNAPCDQSGEVCPLAQAKISGHRERVLHLHVTARIGVVGNERERDGDAPPHIHRAGPARVTAVRGQVGHAVPLARHERLLGEVTLAMRL